MDGQRRSPRPARLAIILAVAALAVVGLLLVHGDGRPTRAGAGSSPSASVAGNPFAGPASRPHLRTGHVVVKSYVAGQ